MENVTLFLNRRTQLYKHVSLFFYLLVLRVRKHTWVGEAQRERERERERENPKQFSELFSAEPRAGLNLMNCEIMT